MRLRRKQSPLRRAVTGSRHLTSAASKPAKAAARPGLMAAAAIAGLTAASSALSSLRKSHDR
jgi:hypothetical protein